MARGQRTNEVKIRAISILMDRMKPAEIAEVLSLPKRTVYQQIELIRYTVGYLEAAQAKEEEILRKQIEREVIERQRQEFRKARNTLSQLLPNTRRFYS